MVKVYLVMYWDYADSSPHGIFSTKEKAQKYIDSCIHDRANLEIEEYELDRY